MGEYSDGTSLYYELDENGEEIATTFYLRILVNINGKRISLFKEEGE